MQAKAHRRLQMMSLHDSVGDVRSGDLATAEPPAVQSLNSFSCGLDAIEAHVDLTLMREEQSAPWSHRGMAFTPT